MNDREKLEAMDNAHDNQFRLCMEIMEVNKGHYDDEEMGYEFLCNDLEQLGISIEFYEKVVDWRIANGV